MVVSWGTETATTAQWKLIRGICRLEYGLLWYQVIYMWWDGVGLFFSVLFFRYDGLFFFLVSAVSFAIYCGVPSYGGGFYQREFEAHLGQDLCALLWIGGYNRGVRSAFLLFNFFFLKPWNKVLFCLLQRELYRGWTFYSFRRVIESFPPIIRNSRSWGIGTTHEQWGQGVCLVIHAPMCDCFLVKWSDSARLLCGFWSKCIVPDSFVHGVR